MGQYSRMVLTVIDNTVTCVRHSCLVICMVCWQSDLLLVVWPASLSHFGSWWLCTCFEFEQSKSLDWRCSVGMTFCSQNLLLLFLLPLCAMWLLFQFLHLHFFFFFCLPLYTLYYICGYYSHFLANISSSLCLMWLLF